MQPSNSSQSLDGRIAQLAFPDDDDFEDGEIGEPSSTDVTMMEQDLLNPTD